MEAIKIRTLKKYFDGFSLDKIRLDIPKGKITGLVGENGAGKTTLIKLIVGSLKPDGGSIWVNGKELKVNREEILNEVYVIMDEPLLMDALIASEYNLMMKKSFNIGMRRSSMRIWKSSSYLSTSKSEISPKA